MAEFDGSASGAASMVGRLSFARAAATKFAARAGLFLLLSAGLFYFIYKFYQPIYGGTDYFRYYPMYLHPLDLRVTLSPFAYRQVSALITHLIYRFGPYYDLQIAFSAPGYDRRVFFAALLTNYLALAACATLTSMAAERLRPGGSPAVPLFAGALCYLSFFAQESGMGPITDGVAWLLMAIGFVGYLNRSLITLGAVLALSVVERETIPIMIAALAAAHLAMTREQRRFDAAVIALSVVAIGVYWLMRTVWAPVAGHAGQTQLSTLVRAFAEWRLMFNKQVLFQGFLTQNLLILLGLNLVWRRWRPGRTPALPAEVSRLIVGLFAAAALIVVVAFITIIGQNVGRILAMLTPVTAALLALALLPEARASTAAPASG